MSIKSILKMEKYKQSFFRNFLKKSLMLKKVIFLSIVFLNLIIINSNISAQTESSKNLKKNIFSGNIMGTSSILGISYQRFLGKKVALEFGVGLIGIGTGLTIYPKGLTTSGTRFYTGIKLNSFVLVGCWRRNNCIYTIRSNFFHRE